MKRILITIILTLALTAFAIQAVGQTALSGAGIIESTSGGFKFPDGSVQTTAAVSARVAEVDCSSETLQSAVDKLDKSTANSLDIFGDCNEDIVISRHQDLTFIGHDGASITATVFDDTPEGFANSTTALFIEKSNITLQNLTINGGSYAARCLDGSACKFRDVTIPSGWSGVSAGQSKLYILGSSLITNLLQSAVGAYTSSHVVMGPDTVFNMIHTI